MFDTRKTKKVVDENSPLGIYRRAATMEAELYGLMGRDPHAPLPNTFATAYNRLLEAARTVAPRSIALTQDLEPIDETHDLAIDDAYHAVHVTLLPTLHNALPEEDYAHI